MAIHLQETVNKTVRMLPEKEEFIRENLPGMIRRVESQQIEPGDFFFISCGGLHVQRLNFIDDGLDEVEVFVKTTVHDWERYSFEDFQKVSPNLDAFFCPGCNDTWDDYALPSVGCPCDTHGTGGGTMTAAEIEAYLTGHLGPDTVPSGRSGGAATEPH